MPWALFGRVWSAIRQNPCTIEVVEQSSDGQQWIRIRNDSAYPTQIFSVSFAWRLDRNQYSHDTPTVWLLSSHLDSVLAPAHSFEHPVDVHEIGEAVEWCKITVSHNRSKYPATKGFRPRIGKAQLRRLKSRNMA